LPRSRRWTTETNQQETTGTANVRGSKWEPTLAFPKTGSHHATLGDRLFAEVHIDVKVQQQRDDSRNEALDGTNTRLAAPFIESVVYDYMGVQDDRTLVLRETSRQGDRIERSTLFVKLNLDGATKIRFPSGVVSVMLDEEQVAIVRWIGS
jgi:hypothetical protein